MTRSTRVTAGLVAVSLTLAGCASTGFLGFLATTKYVDTHVAAEKSDTQAQFAETNNNVRKVQSYVQNVHELEVTLRSLIDDIKANQESTRELKALVGQLRSRLDAIPEETLRELVNILQEYLAKKSPAVAPAP
ncbi:MAG TPA: hypothetical protein VMW73_04465 [Spirochaetia bacterium]|nr:hypothetical protein [Spirochaetia bacterium]